MKAVNLSIAFLALFYINSALAVPDPKCALVENWNEEECDAPAQCTQQDVDEKEPECECATAQELEKIIAVHQSNIETLINAKNALRETLNALRAASAEILSHVNGFEYEVAGRCALAGIEAYGAAKVLTTFKATCGHLGFAAQCQAAGFTSREVAKYLLTKQAVVDTAEGLIISSISVIARHGIPQEPSPWSYSIPIVGGWCAAYDSSQIVFTSPEALDALGRQQARVLKQIGKLNEMIKSEQDAIAELRHQIAEACDNNTGNTPVP